MEWDWDAIHFGIVIEVQIEIEEGTRLGWGGDGINFGIGILVKAEMGMGLRWGQEWERRGWDWGSLWEWDGIRIRQTLGSGQG